MSYLSKALRYTGVAALLIVLLVGPFYRGLFFWEDQLPGLILLLTGIGAWALGRHLARLPVDLPGGPAGWALLGLTATYAMQFLWASWFRGNVDWTLRVLAGWLVWVMIRAESGPRLRRVLGWSFLLGAFAVALVGLLEYTGYFAANPDIAGGLARVGLSDRLPTVYQYPNTGAAVLVAAIFMAVGLCLDNDRPWWTALVGALSGVISLAFIFTLSRGAVLVIPFGFLFLLLGLQWRQVWKATLLTATLLFLPIALAMNKVAATLPKHDWETAMRWVVIAAVVTAIVAGLLGLLYRLRGRVQAGLVALVLLAGVGAFLAFRPEGPLIPPMAKRLFIINFSEKHVVMRLHYYKTALKIGADEPFGHGGWGWERNYRRYQDFNFYATETHNHYAQTLVEGGIQGLFALAAAILLAIWTAFRRRRGDPLRWSLTAAGATIAGHSLVDFDLSYVTVWLLMVTYLAAAADPPFGEKPEPKHRWLLVAVPALAAAVSAVPLALGAHHLSEAGRLQAEKDNEGTIAAIHRALQYDPWDTTGMVALNTEEMLQRTVKIDPHNAEAWRALATKLELKKDWEGAYKAARRALEEHPTNLNHYEAYARLAGFRLSDLLSDGKVEEARELGKELAAWGDRFESTRVVADSLHRLWRFELKLQWTKLLYLHFAKGYFLTGDVERAERYFKQTTNEWAYASDAEVWLYAIYERQGRTKDMEALARKPWIRFRKGNDTFKALQQWKS